MLQMAIEQDVIDAPENHLSGFSLPRGTAPVRTLSRFSILEKTFFREFILSPPTAVRI